MLDFNDNVMFSLNFHDSRLFFNDFCLHSSWLQFCFVSVFVDVCAKHYVLCAIHIVFSKVRNSSPLMWEDNVQYSYDTDMIYDQ